MCAIAQAAAHRASSSASAQARSAACDADCGWWLWLRLCRQGQSRPAAIRARPGPDRTQALGQGVWQQPLGQRQRVGTCKQAADQAHRWRSPMRRLTRWQCAPLRLRGAWACQAAASSASAGRPCAGGAASRRLRGGHCARGVWRQPACPAAHRSAARPARTRQRPGRSGRPAPRQNECPAAPAPGAGAPELSVVGTAGKALWKALGPRRAASGRSSSVGQEHTVRQCERLLQQVLAHAEK